MDGNFPWRNKWVNGPNAWCNNHMLSRWDVIGCNSYASEYWWFTKHTRNIHFIVFHIYFISAGSDLSDKCRKKHLFHIYFNSCYMCGRLQVGAQIPHRRKIFLWGGAVNSEPIKKACALVHWLTEWRISNRRQLFGRWQKWHGRLLSVLQQLVFFSFYPSPLIDGNYVSKVEIVQLCPQSCCLRKTAGHTDKPVKTTFSEIKSQ